MVEGSPVLVVEELLPGVRESIRCTGSGLWGGGGGGGGEGGGEGEGRGECDTYMYSCDKAYHMYMYVTSCHGS